MMIIVVMMVVTMRVVMTTTIVQNAVKFVYVIQGIVFAHLGNNAHKIL